MPTTTAVGRIDSINAVPIEGPSVMASVLFWLRERRFGIGFAALTLVAGLTLRATLGGALAKYGGVALWATLVYALELVVRPRLGPRLAWGLCVVISFAVEFLQLSPLPMALYEVHPFFALVFGTTFHVPDLPSYVAGATIGLGVHLAGTSWGLSRPARTKR